MSFAAIIASAAWAGAGPGLAATALLVIWSAFDLSRHGISAGNVVVRCLVFCVEGVLLSVGSSRMWRSMRDAATSETWHRQLVDTAAEGIWVHDDRGVITYVNARMSEILGLPVKDLIGRNVGEFFFPEDESVERVRAANLRNGRKEQFDRRLKRADGSEAWVLTSCNLIGAETPVTETPGSLAMMTDITERKRAEYALRRSEERFRNLFENVLEGVYQSTPDGRILAANPMILKMFGIAREELNDLDIGKDFYLEPNLRHRLLEQMERDGGYQNVEYELRRRDGQIITVLENARVVRDENGAVLYFEGTMTDITPRKRMEEQLRQAQKVEALGKLAGSIAGDFNNSLTIITGYAQLALADLPLTHPARANTEQALEAAERAMALTKHLLLFSRRQTPAGQALDLNEALKNSEAVREAGLARLHLTSDPAPVYAAQDQIDTLVRDLTVNLQRSDPSVSLSLNTETANLDEDFARRCAGAPGGPCAVLSIGRPNSASGAAEVFSDPFATAMHAGESAAIGIPATHAIVTQCGGFIVAAGREPADGSPSGFHVFLPCAAEMTEEMRRSGEPPPARETILLVEDEPLIRELSRDLLERQGYRVILAANAREAEQMSRSAGSFDLLITDTIMPNSTGAELARKLRAAHPGLKVLYIAGYADNAPQGDEMAEGGAFLQKPFSADSLGRKIRQIFSN